MNLFDLDLQLFPESGLTHRLGERIFDDDVFARVLVVGFSGEYRPGSAGTPDAETMIAVLGAALARFEPDAVVLDLVELEYRWGNGLLGVLDCPSHWDSPDPPELAIASGPACRPALESLLTPKWGRPPEFLCSDLESAMDYALERAVERARRIE